MPETKRQVPEYKLKLVKDLAGLIDNKNTIMITSIKGLPAAQFQKIKKKLSGKAEVRIVKKRILNMAVEKSKKSDIKKLKDFIKEDIAVLISDIDSFELAKSLIENKSPIKAKTGQQAPEDIKIDAGPTSLPAGPAVSELGSLGLTVKIREGKIEILQPKVIVGKGKIINETAAGVMAKLNVLPFSVGFIPVASYDSKLNLIFTELNVDPKTTLETMKQMFSKATLFAVSIGFVCKETLRLLLAKASSHENAIANLIKEDNKNEKETEQKKQEDENEEVVEEKEEIKNE